MSLRRSVCFSAGAALALVLIAPRAASACSCEPSGPPCQAYFNSDAVFVATVRSIEVRAVVYERIEGMITRKLVRFSIERAARGVQGLEIEVWTGMYEGDCGYGFKIGRRYVVYARRLKDGTLNASSCSRTRPVSEARDDLAYLSALGLAGTGARVSGAVKYQNFFVKPSGRAKPEGVTDVQVFVRGSAGVFSATTDAEGRYAINAVPPGAYEIEVLPPAVFTKLGLWGSFDIKDPRACQVQDFWLHYAGRIVGAVLDASGQPAAGVRVEIAPSAAPEEPLRWIFHLPSDANGRFELADIQPGSYVVGVGLEHARDATVYARTVLPPIEVGRGNRVDAGVLRLPEPSRRYELKGVAVDATGVPVAGAFVVLRSRGLQLTEPVKTGIGGGFTIPVFEGQTYTVDVYDYVSQDSFRETRASQVVRVTGDPQPIRLVLVVRSRR